MYESYEFFFSDAKLRCISCVCKKWREIFFGLLRHTFRFATNRPRALIFCRKKGQRTKVKGLRSKALLHEKVKKTSFYLLFSLLIRTFVVPKLKT